MTLSTVQCDSRQNVEDRCFGHSFLIRNDAGIYRVLGCALDQQLLEIVDLKADLVLVHARRRCLSGAPPKASANSRVVVGQRNGLFVSGNSCRPRRFLDVPILCRPFLLSDQRHGSNDSRSLPRRRLHGEPSVHQTYPFLHTQ
jgi:hypothetical protein